MRKIPKLERKNYHRIILKNNPRFNRKMFQFEFEDGEVLWPTKWLRALRN